MNTKKYLLNLVGHNNFDFQLCYAGGTFIKDISTMRKLYPHGGKITLAGYTYFVWEN